MTELPTANRQTVISREFFAHIISGPFHRGLVEVLIVAALSRFAAVVPLFRGARYIHRVGDESDERQMTSEAPIRGVFPVRLEPATEDSGDDRDRGLGSNLPSDPPVPIDDCSGIRIIWFPKYGLHGGGAEQGCFGAPRERS